MDAREEGQQTEHGDNLELELLALGAIRSGKVRSRRNRRPTAITAMTRTTAITTMKTLVSPGAAMNTGS